MGSRKNNKGILYIIIVLVLVCAVCIFSKISKSSGEKKVTKINSNEELVVDEKKNERLSGGIIDLQSGFYESGTAVALAVPKDTVVYYTLDGSLPSKGKEGTFCIEDSASIVLEDASKQPNVYSERSDSSIAYEEYMVYAGLEEPIYKVPEMPVDKCNVLRAIAVGKNDEVVASQTEVYFVGFENKSGYDSLKMVTLVMEPDDFWGYERGINILGKTFDEADKEELFEKYGNAYGFYDANYRNSGVDWERETQIFIFDEKGDLIEEKTAGIRIKGNGSRGGAQKSFNLYARKRYDNDNSFSNKIFDSGAECKKISLFNGGVYRYDKVADVLASEFAGNLNFGTLEYEPCVLFINGEYWGFYYLSEAIDAKYIANNYGVKVDNVIVVKNRSIEEGLDTDLTIYLDMLDYIVNNDMSVEANYLKACELIDIRSFIDYYAYEIYIDNADWPGNNVALWRVKEATQEDYCDGKWRWILFDTDAAFGRPDFDDLARVIESDSMFLSLFQNEQFRADFFERLFDIGNICFNDSLVESYITEYRYSRKTTIEKSIERWYCDDTISNLVNATQNISEYSVYRFRSIKNSIIEYNSNFLKDKEEIDSTDNEIKNINKTAYILLLSEFGDQDTKILLNGLEVGSNDGEWVGEYFVGTEVKLEALAKGDKKFIGWKINDASEYIEDREYKFVLEETVHIEAVFE